MPQHKAGIETKNRIYEAAEKLFYENGYLNTKVTDIINLSNTNKGSFYHHYENKSALGLSVFLATVDEHMKASQIFTDLDTLLKFSVEIAIFWYTYFQDSNIRRFSSELNSEGIIFDDERIYRICLDNTQKEISDKEFLLIRVANVALYKQLTVFFYNQTERYSFVEARNFYLRTLFELFKIPRVTIDFALEESMKLFSKLKISMNGFHVQVSL